MTFKIDCRNWVEFRNLPDLLELDMHWSNEPCTGNYYENMAAVLVFVRKALQDAQQKGKKYVMFCHGHSTSRVGKTTTRSQVRKFMKSKEATPLVVRRECIQHFSVFVAAIKPLPAGDQSQPQ